MTEITLFTTKPTGGGAELIFTRLAKEFSKRGIETDFLILNTGDRVFNSGQANIIEIPHSRIRYVIPWLVQYLNENSPEVIYSTLTGPNLVTIVARKISNTNSTLIVNEAAVRSESASVNKSVKDKMMNVGIRTLYPQSDYVVTVSQYAGKDMRGFLDNNSNNVVSIPNPINVEEVQRDATEQVQHKWFSGKYKIVLGAGRLAPVKDFETLIESFNIYSETNDRLVILGEGRERDKLEQYVKQQGITGVDFLGYVDNPYKYMKRADVFVSTSKYEAFGNVIVEALACGTPVIATDCPGGPPEIINHKKYGKLAPVGDVEKIASLLQNVINSEYDQNILVNRARDYSIKSIASQYLELADLQKI